MASAKEIPPGGEGKIDVTFKTGGAGSNGKRAKHISVTTNDPDNKNISLAISAMVQEKVGITPNRVNFNQVKKGAEHVLYASLSGEEKDKVKLTGADSPNPNIKVELNPKGYNGDVYQQIKIVLLPTIRGGRFFERVMLHTDHPEMKDIQLNVMGEVTGDIAVVPNQLHFGLFQQGKKIDRVLVVKATAEARFKVLEVKSTIPDVTTSIETVAQDREYRIHAQLTDAFAGNTLKGKLVITTDLKEDSNLEIDIAGRKLPPAAAVQNPQPSPGWPSANPSAIPAPPSEKLPQ